MALKTTELVPGDRVQLISFGDISYAYRQKLIAFGIRTCQKARVVRKAPFGSPIQLDICGSAIMLRADEADTLIWERV